MMADTISNQIEHHRKEASSIMSSLLLTVLFLGLICFVFIAPEIATTLKDAKTDKTDTIYLILDTISQINITSSKMEFILTAAPLLFGGVIAGFFLSYRHHVQLQFELIKLQEETEASKVSRLILPK